MSKRKTDFLYSNIIKKVQQVILEKIIVFLVSRDKIRQWLIGFVRC